MHVSYKIEDKKLLWRIAMRTDVSFRAHQSAWKSWECDLLLLIFTCNLMSIDSLKVF